MLLACFLYLYISCLRVLSAQVLCYFWFLASLIAQMDCFLQVYFLLKIRIFPSKYLFCHFLIICSIFLFCLFLVAKVKLYCWLVFLLDLMLIFLLSLFL